MYIYDSLQLGKTHNITRLVHLIFFFLKAYHVLHFKTLSCFRTENCGFSYRKQKASHRAARSPEVLDFIVASEVKWDEQNDSWLVLLRCGCSCSSCKSQESTAC